MKRKREQFNRIDSEAGVIASLINNPELYFTAEQLKPKHFTNTQNASVYMAVSMAAQSGIQEIDPYMILEILNKNEETRCYAEPLTVEGLKELFDVSDVLARNTQEEYSVLTNNVLDAAFRREATACLEECIEYCNDKDSEYVRELIYEKIDTVISDYSDATDMPLYKDVVDDIWEHVKARQRGETNAIGFPYTELNKYVVLEPGEAVCFIGGPKAGKSAMLLTITVDMLRKNKSILYVDSEISTELFTIRMLSHITGIRFGTIRSGKFTQEEEQIIDEALEWIKTRNFIHIYMPVLTSDELYIAAKKAKHLINIDCIVVDYLKADTSKEQAFEVYANLGAVGETLKNRIAGDMGIAALTAAQSTASGKIADSARIARSMSTVVSILDKPIEEVEQDGTGATKKLRVIFNRNGAQMQENEWIDMVFDGSHCKYAQAEHQHEAIEPY